MTTTFLYPEDLLAGLKLKEMDAALLTHSIMQKSQAFGDFSAMRINSALVLASYLHRAQTRSNRANMPRTHYIEHPLRAAERLLRYGVTNPDIIIAAILHDTVEDCLTGFGVLMSLGRDATYIEGLRYLVQHFGPNVTYKVSSLTNPLWAEGATKAQKRVEYAKHVSDIVDDADIWLLKFVDWVDNAVGLHHNVSSANMGMVAHLAAKYLPLEQIFRDNLSAEVEALVSSEGLKSIHKHLDSGHRSLTKLVAA